VGGAEELLDGIIFVVAGKGENGCTRIRNGTREFEFVKG
jgi:hypothetical protein